MARRGRKPRKKITVHKVHDIRDRYGEMPGGITDRAPIEVDDPNSPPGETHKLIVMRMIRDDPLGEMHAERAVDDAQFLAGRKWQADYEKVCLGSLRGINLANDPVQGGGAPDAFSFARAIAAQRLKEASQALGREGDLVIHGVLADGKSIRQIARERGNEGGYARAVIGDLFYKSLEILVIFFDLAGERMAA